MKYVTSLIVAFSLASQVHAARAIPDNNLAYPVLINLEGGSSGSGFFISIGSVTYLVTARHVLFQDPGTPGSTLRGESAEVLSYCNNPNEAARNRLTLNLKALLAGNHVRPHATRDVAVVALATLDTPGDVKALHLLPGVTVNETCSQGLVIAQREILRLYEDVLVANEVIVFGYPTSLGLKAVPQLDLTRPLLRRGIVAGLNRSLRSIVLDCPAYPGNSGGPVLEVDQDLLNRTFRVIGVVSQFVPSVETWFNLTHGHTNSSILNSGYSIATPIDFVLELTGP